MKKGFTSFKPFLLLLIFFLSTLSASPILFGQTFMGDKTLTTQAEVDDFGANYTGISGSLIIGEGSPSAILNLDALITISSIGSSLLIFDNAAITNLDGLASISIINDILWVNNNDALTNIGGLENITSISNSLTVLDNAVLTNIDGLENVTSVGIGHLWVRDNAALTNVNGLANITSVELDLHITNNTALTNVNGLANIASVGDKLLVVNNEALTNLEGLANVTSVGDILSILNNDVLTSINFSKLASVGGHLLINNNPVLPDLDDFSSLTSVEGNLLISNNGALTSCCGIAHLVDDDENNGQVDGLISVYSNPNGCSSISDIIEACSPFPPGWNADPNGIGCTDGNDVSFDNNTQTFTITSEGCYDPNYYSTSDAHGFVYTELCGDGEIIAEIQSVSGDGWAGVSVRESTDPGAKMMQLLIDGIYLTRRQMRTSTNGMAFNHQFQTQGKNWLRLTRSGNSFSAQHSLDGINWSTVLATNLSLPNCIPIGLVTMNNQASGALTAVFGNVDIKSNAALYTPRTIDIVQSEQQFSIYPNPADDQLWISLPQAIEQEVRIKVYNQLGQAVLQYKVTTTQSIDISALLPGAYWVAIMADGLRVVRKMVVE